MKHRKKRYIAGVLLAALLLTSCAPATEELAWPKFGPAPEGAITPYTQREPAPPPNPDTHLWFSRALEDGESIQVPALTREEQGAYAQLEDYPEQFRQRLGLYGIHLSDEGLASLLGDIDPVTPDYLGLPVTVIHYKSWDVLAFRYQKIRSDSCNIYLFENSAFKDAARDIGDVNFNDCFRELEENLWFVSWWPFWGYGFSVTVTQWRNLGVVDFPVELDYPSDMMTSSNFLEGDASAPEFFLRQEYKTSEQALFFNEQGFPTLQVYFQKLLTDDEFLIMTVEGTTEYPIGPEIVDNRFPLWSTDFASGMEDQLKVFIEDGTPEQRERAQQILEHLT